MRLYTCYSGKQYKRLANVLKRSTKAHCDVTVSMQGYDEPEDDIGPRRLTKFLKHKLRLWREQIERANDLLILADADMLVRGDITQVFAERPHADVIYTRRGKGINGGIWWVTPTDESRWLFRFIEHLFGVLCDAGDMGERWRHDHYGAVDQAAMLTAVQCPPPRLNLASVPCGKWNACDEHWSGSDDPQVVHIKGQLRERCLAGASGNDALTRWVREWKQYA